MRSNNVVRKLRRFAPNQPGKDTVPDVPPLGNAAAAVGEDTGLRKGLHNRQVQMIAIGGAIGTGLFLGAGSRLAQAGPALAIIYAVCGFFGFLVLRALGELVAHRPTSGSFVSYAREFFGEKMAFAAGWMYWLNWAVTGIVDSTAVALYIQFFNGYLPGLAAIPQWVFAFAVVTLVLVVNLLAVTVFGELEFWFSVLKVGAIVAFLVVGLFFLITGTPVAGHQPGFDILATNGGIFPNGLLPAIIVTQGVIFAYSGIELLGITAGEVKDPAKTIPRAINAVIVRIGVFYVGSVALLALLLPYGEYKAGVSPFVTFFDSIGVEGAAAAINLVVLTAAVSSLNAGLYSTGRILRSMALAGSAPRFASRVSASGVPYGGIILTAGVAMVGVALNAIAPREAFEIVLHVASLGILSAWSVIVLCQLKLFKLSRIGAIQRPAYRMFGAPVTGIITLVFLALVLALMAWDFPVGTFTVASVGIVVPCLIGGWYLVRGRIAKLGRERAHDIPGAFGMPDTVNDAAGATDGGT